MPSLHITTSKPNHLIPKHHIHIPDFSTWVQEYETGLITFSEVGNKFLHKVSAQRNNNLPMDEIVLDTACYSWGLCEPLEKWLKVPVRWSQAVALTLDNPTETDYIDHLINQVERPHSTLSSVTLLPAYLPGKGAAYGLQQIFEWRLSGRLNPIILLSFQTAKQLQDLDVYGMLVQPDVYVLRLPIWKVELQEVLQDISSRTIAGSAIKEALIVPARQLAQEIISLWRHGREKDLVNSLLIPMRMALYNVLFEDVGHEDFTEKYSKFIAFYSSSEMQKLLSASNFLNQWSELQSFCTACNAINIYSYERTYNDGLFDYIGDAIAGFQKLTQ